MGIFKKNLQRVCVLGATGSIGDSTFKVLDLHPERYQVYAISGHQRLSRLVALCVRYQPAVVVVPDGQAMQMQQLLRDAGAVRLPEILEGEAGLCVIAAHSEVDVVMAAIVGAAGLAPTMAAAQEVSGFYWPIKNRW